MSRLGLIPEVRNWSALKQVAQKCRNGPCRRKEPNTEGDPFEGWSSEETDVEDEDG